MDDTVKLTPEQERARRRRNVLIALAVLAFVVLVFFITIVKVQHGGLNP
ncbi:MAG: protoheme IX farnesyltransferase [Pseudomonadota bacterium]